MGIGNKIMCAAEFRELLCAALYSLHIYTHHTQIVE